MRPKFRPFLPDASSAVKTVHGVLYRRFPWMDFKARCGTASGPAGMASCSEILPGLRLDVSAPASGGEGKCRIALLSGPPASRRRHPVDWATEAGFLIGIVDDEWTKPFPGWSELVSFEVPMDEQSIQEGAGDALSIALDWPEPAFVVGVVGNVRKPLEIPLRNMAPARVNFGNKIVALADPLGLTFQHFGSWRHAAPPGADVVEITWGRKLTVAEFFKEIVGKKP